MNAAANDYGAAEAKVDADTILRENIAAGRQTEIKLCRDLVMVSDATTGGLVPVKVQDILGPLTEGLILDNPLTTAAYGKNQTNNEFIIVSHFIIF